MSQLLNNTLQSFIQLSLSFISIFILITILSNQVNCAPVGHTGEIAKSESTESAGKSFLETNSRYVGNRLIFKYIFFSSCEKIRKEWTCDIN